jgi:hypothetical protein
MAAPQIHVKVGGFWKGLKVSEALKVKVGGTWKNVTNAYVRVGGAWKLAYASIDYTLGLPASTWNIHNERLVGTAYCAAGFSCRTTGRLTEYNGNGTESDVLDSWIHETAIGNITGSDYEAQLSGMGSLTGGGSIEENFPAYNNYYGLGTERNLKISRTTAGTSELNGTLTVREVANTANNVSVTFDLDAFLTT